MNYIEIKGNDKYLKKWHFLIILLHLYAIEVIYISCVCTVGN